MPDARDEFYVGYLARCPPGIASRVRLGVGAAIGIAAVLALLLAAGQSRFDAGTFEFGVEREIDGLVVERPYPMLLVPGDDGTFATHTLVAPGKHGADALVAGRDGTAARVRGSRIHDRGERMIEIHAIAAAPRDVAARIDALRRAGEQRLGTMTLAGEIVDSKCHLGVMKPGRGKPHKACAIRCISGGIPPALRVEDRTGRVDSFLLVGTDGRSVQREVLDLVAEPVEITGEVARAGDVLLLYAEPSGYRRRGSDR